MTLKENIAKFYKLRGRLDLLTEERDEFAERLNIWRVRQDAVDASSVVIQSVAKESQEKVKLQLSSLVTNAVRTIYPEEDYSFDMEFVSERGQTSVYPLLILDGNEFDPLSSSGGMAEVIAFALRIALIAIGKKPKIMLLDEPFTGVSTTRLPLVQDVISQMSKDFGMQFIITTHLDGLTEGADQSFVIIKEGNYSKVETS